MCTFQLQIRMKQEENHRDELVSTIMKFRKKVGELNEEIQDLKDQLLEVLNELQVLKYQEQLLGRKSEESSIASIASQMQVNANRTFAEFPEVPGGTRREHVTKSHKAEQWAHSARITYTMNALVAVCGQFESALTNISLEDLARLAQLQPEMSTQEKVIDGYLELLRQSRLDAETSLENMEKVVIYFQPGMDGCDVSKLVDMVNSALAECERLAIRAGKSVPTNDCLKLTPQVNDDIQSAIHHLERLALILHETCSIASVQINMNPELDGFESTRLKEMIHGEVEKVNGSITLEKTDERIRRVVGNIVNKMISRFCNYKVMLRLNMAEARIESAGKQDNVKMQHLEAKIEQLVTDNKKKQIEFDETMDALQKELKESERENAELKQMAKNFSRKTLLENIQRIESRATMSSAQVTSQVGIVLGREESALLEQQLADSRDALRRATLEIIELKTALSLAQPHSGVMRLPDMVCGPETLRMKENDAGLEAISKEIEQLKRDELKYLVYIRDPSRPRHLQEQDKIQFEKERNAYNDKVSTVRCAKYGSQDFKDICNKLGVKVDNICN
uniref:Dynactin domain-containing protein n=1 Tax=Angiostrongylus cantonensis TaxID=6313 RepID=A0A158P5Z7_ANGCA